MNNVQTKAINNLLFNCGCLHSQDRVLILCDPETRTLADVFYRLAYETDHDVEMMEIPSLSYHGDEPPVHAALAMQSATLILSLCRYSLAHSAARINAGLAGARFLSLPLYDWKLLEDPSLQIDFKSQFNVVKEITQAFTNGKSVYVTTKAGTDIHLDINGRVGNCCPGFVEHPGDLGSPPDIESNISPIENASEGIVIVDGSITHPSLGLMSSSIELKVSYGRIVAFDGENKKHLAILEDMFAPEDSLRRILAECGVGLNPAAKLTGIMLTDEGAFGCVHFGFGSNYTVGGKNKVDFHLDFVFQRANLAVDGQYLLIDGVLQ